MSGILTNCFRQSLLAVRQQTVPKAGIVYGPPRVKVSKAFFSFCEYAEAEHVYNLQINANYAAIIKIKEKYGLGTIMVSLIILPAGYILSSLKHYQK